MRLDLVLTALHVSALTVWIGSVFAAFVAARVTSVDDATRHDIAKHVFKWVATPAFAVAFVFGAIRLGLDYRYYFVNSHFMHAKLPLALVAIGAHHFLAACVRKSASARAFRNKSTTVAAMTFGLSCFAAVFIVMLRLP